MPTPQLKIAVGIATTGRRDVLSETIDLIARQSRPADRLVICPVTTDDIDQAALDRFPSPTSVVRGVTGLPAQRNLILNAVLDADIIVFFDDDFFPRRDYLAAVESLFLAAPDVAAITGRPIEDGAHGPGLSVERGIALISETTRKLSPDGQLADTYGTYGCNMAFRARWIRDHGIRFDENLPLYGWQEDIDFSSQLRRFGRVVESDWLQGVHLGFKMGRTSGIRLGYSQIANPLYLMRKGTMPWPYARSLMVRNLAANLIRSVKPEPWIDRRGRLKGNALALLDAVFGRVSPHRILSLGKANNT